MINLWQDLEAKLRDKLDNAKKDPDKIAALTKLIQETPDLKGQLLTVLALQIAKEKKDKKKALKTLAQARANLVDNYEWLKHCLLKEWGINHYCDED